jgi:hypothetical protein
LCVLARQSLTTRNAHDRGIRQPIGEQLIQLGLAAVVQIRGSLIQKQPPWPLQQRSGKGNALLVCA